MNASALAVRTGIALLVLAGSTSHPRGVSFFPNPVTDAGPAPNSIVTADFNGDGIVDAAVANRASDDVAVFPGFGDGTFGPPARYPVGNDPFKIVTADFSGDAVLDLAVLNIAYPGSLAMLFGRPDGTFQPAVFTPDIYGLMLEAVDMSGDGRPDIVVLMGGPCVLVNAGDGSLLPPACRSSVADPKSLAIADFNGDGRADAAVGGSDAVAVHLGTGGGALSAPILSPSAATSYWLATADFDRDGKMDLVSVYVSQYPAPGAPDGLVRVLLGNGAGAFGGAADLLTTAYVNFVTTGDFNGDDIPDVAASGQGGLDVLLGTGDGTLSPARFYKAAWTARSLAVADLNGDGHSDLAAATIGDQYAGNRISVDGLIAFLGSGDGTFGQPHYGDGAAGGGIARADLDGDGHEDLAVAENAYDRVSILRGRGDGSFMDPVHFPTGDNPMGIALGDFNQDGDVDIATALQYGIVILLGSGDGTFSAPAYFPGGEYHSTIVTADFNGDGILDLATPNLGYANVSVFWGIGDGTILSHTRVPSGLNPWSYNTTGLATGDVDGNGIADLVVGSSADAVSPGGLAIVRMLGGYAFAPPVYLAWGSIPAFVLVQDVDADGHPDLVAAGDGSDAITFFHALGDGAFGPRQVLAAGDSPTSVAAGDIDGDGNLDLVVGDAGSSDVAVLRGDGAGGYAPRLRYATHYGFGIVLGDFDEDGHTDVAAAIAGNLVAIVLNSGAGPQHPPVAAAGPDQVVECASSAGTPVAFDGSASSDIDSTPGTNDDIGTFRWYEGFGTPGQTLLGTGEIATLTLGLGTHVVTLQVTDRTSQQALDDVIVTIEDTLAPGVGIVLAPALWPPNHRLVPVTAVFDVTEACGPVSATLVSLVSSEPDDAPGGADGATTNDIAGADIGTADTEYLLRAERAAGGPGRTYTAIYNVSDGAGHTVVAGAVATVPHDVDGVTDPITISLSETPEGTLIEWTPVAGAERYSVAIGDLASLIAFDPDVGIAPPGCLVSPLFTTSTAGFEFAGAPQPGAGYFFVVSYTLSARSGYGSESAPFDLDVVVPADVCP